MIPTQPLTDEMEFEDGENFRGSDNQAQSYGQIVLRHLRDSIVAGSKEMTNGGVQRRIINGQAVEVSVPNTKEIFINSVEMLHHLLYSEFVKHKTFNEEITKIDKKLEEIQGEISSEKNAQMEDVMSTFRARRNLFSDPEKTQNQVMKRYSMEEEELHIQATHKKLRVIVKLLAELNYFKEKGGMHGVN